MFIRPEGHRTEAETTKVGRMDGPQADSQRSNRQGSRAPPPGSYEGGRCETEIRSDRLEGLRFTKRDQPRWLTFTGVGVFFENSTGCFCDGQCVGLATAIVWWRLRVVLTRGLRL